MAERNQTILSGNCCLVPWSVIPVDASDSFDTILDAIRSGKHETIPTPDQLVDHTIDSLLIGKDKQSLGYECC